MKFVFITLQASTTDCNRYCEFTKFLKSYWRRLRIFLKLTVFLGLSFDV